MVIAIRFFDVFAGIGGFRSGLEQAGGFKCVGFCEIDRHAAVSTNAGGSSFKSVLRICQAAQVALLRSPILLADKNSITDLENA